MNHRFPVYVALLAASCFGITPVTFRGQGSSGKSVRVERQRILFYSKEYLRHSQYLQGRDHDTIAAWGWRILEWGLDSTRYEERVPEDPKYRFSNGACAMDVNGDGEDELIIGRYERENWPGHEILWYERPSNRKTWIAHQIGIIHAPGKEMPHDIACLSVPLPGGKVFTGIFLTIDREDIYLFERPADPKKPWPRYDLGKLPSRQQSGMVVADINRDGRPDVVTGMYWLECPPDPRIGPWKAHRFGDWDKTNPPWGGMNKHGVADFNNDGSLDIVVDEAEIPGARLAIFTRDPKHPDHLWTSKEIDTGLYCPHTMAVADLNGDGRPDIVVGEMSAGGWEVPMNPYPRIYAYINQGNLTFRRIVLSDGFGIHEGKIAPQLFEGKILLYGNSTSQTWFDGQTTHLSTWTLEKATN